MFKNIFGKRSETIEKPSNVVEKKPKGCEEGMGHAKRIRDDAHEGVNQVMWLLDGESKHAVKGLNMETSEDLEKLCYFISQHKLCSGLYLVKDVNDAKAESFILISDRGSASVLHTPSYDLEYLTRQGNGDYQEIFIQDLRIDEKKAEYENQVAKDQKRMDEGQSIGEVMNKFKKDLPGLLKNK